MVHQNKWKYPPEKRMESLLIMCSTISLGVAVLSLEGRILIHNDQFLKQLNIQFTSQLFEVFPHLNSMFKTSLQQKDREVYWFEEKELLLCITSIQGFQKTDCKLCFAFDRSVSLYDDSEKKEMENLVSQLDAIIDCTTEGIWVCDGEGNVLRVNPVSAEMNNIKESDVIGKNMADLESQGFFKGCTTLDAIKYRKTVTNLVHLQRTDTMVIATAKPIFDDNNNLTMIVGTERDISRLEDQHYSLRKQAELQSSLKAHIEELNAINKISQNFIAKSKAMIRVVKQVIKVSSVNSTVLILGESGVGKTAIAELIHNNSNRSEGPFFSINCSAIPETLLESELFGYEQGAFTGAKKMGKAGIIEMADKGTLFLDEISEISIGSQAKLLKFIDEGYFFRIGSIKKKIVDIRIIAATNQDLRALVDQGKFRQDLYYRLNVISLTIPPLRERYNCITALLKYYINHFACEMGLKRKLSPKAFSLLASYHFPGNVRELINICERAVVMTENEYILPSDLPQEVLENVKTNISNSLSLAEGESLPGFVSRLEREILLKAQLEYKSQKKMAMALGVTQPTINRKMKKYGIARS